MLCRSAGWYPQPEVLWRDAGGQRVPSVSQRSSADERGLFEFEDVIVVTGKGPGNWSCVVRNSRLSQEQESSLHISGATLAAGPGGVWGPGGVCTFTSALGHEMPRVLQVSSGLSTGWEDDGPSGPAVPGQGL